MQLTKIFYMRYFGCVRENIPSINVMFSGAISCFYKNDLFCFYVLQKPIYLRLQSYTRLLQNQTHHSNIKKPYLRFLFFFFFFFFFNKIMSRAFSDTDEYSDQGVSIQLCIIILLFTPFTVARLSCRPFLITLRSFGTRL